MHAVGCSDKLLFQIKKLQLFRQTWQNGTSLCNFKLLTWDGRSKTKEEECCHLWLRQLILLKFFVCETRI